MHFPGKRQIPKDLAVGPVTQEQTDLRISKLEKNLESLLGEIRAMKARMGKKKEGD